MNKQIGFPFIAFFKYPVSSQLVSIRLIFTIIMDFIFPEINVRVFQFIYYRMQKSLFRKSVLIIPEMGEVNIMQKCLKFSGKAFRTIHAVLICLIG